MKYFTAEHIQAFTGQFKDSLYIYIGTLELQLHNAVA